MNWIDWVILAITGYYIVEGWEDGAVKLVADVVTFLGALWLAIRYHSLAGRFLGEKFGISRTWTEVLGYVVVGFGAELVISGILAAAAGKLPEKFWKSKLNQVLGSAVSIAKGLVLVAFGLLVILTLPLRGTVRKDIKSSLLGSRLVVAAEKYGGEVKSSLDEAAAAAVRFLTVKPQSTERVSLQALPETCAVAVDEAAERQVLELVNNERAAAGGVQLRVDNRMTAVARAHSRDMFERKYFSHYSPEGLNAAQRLEKSGVRYSLMGENLAYAPDVQTAHQGLMDSEGHRRNILDKRFTRVGVGAVNGEECGLMITQVFAD
ncbi:hypothetical protein A3H89_01635 [Candidatus Amesbacteria bacterium RIFCSPLOWO2_02_FULL_48_11]|uniref:SCP domain-containing protein n=3 Tax=Candidatus Amesiibacteriota TaxID=1752730 RepID=A0A1F4Z8S8_9BACT|nr:MAG: putative membrane protein [Candidatus Amesbacteria bacterium GW2011_GWA2_47_11]KKW00019.1 MAG: putative membrane protein [Candidatus Amesbacteria bacterium GW2011_GWA1_48_9]OGC90649.1 MAG: hypothetical protein A2V48_04065 [Candidatus Amesbacteria bacterium RBG_19FT_COMBO_48_16]OGC99214.1 MAG: hypothetical protein A2W16_03100 [Candidatus Amesbacteria bacterium RBG_16_48_31]OGC99297.1 MAG: hypothetical protein A2702_00255 [Candidatus Amesbacteria bacterium RIFCSPHIGHO2_01_FULL_48_75]OGD0